ncbi:MAG: ArsR family transcriptional regulator [Deltaproteobacteria bacterium]|nr:MAG: ArsR family transcriptional regulator [Deltaproteobacteria bacterium]TMQ23569.1 MAG: ArsR family transcriptional regulator [Deltaproteobacteria bacterium]
MTAERIDPHTARADIASSKALLVCAYDSPEKCQQYALDGAIDLDELRRREPSLPRQQEIIFYCA